MTSIGSKGGWEIKFPTKGKLDLGQSDLLNGHIAIQDKTGRHPQRSGEHELSNKIRRTHTRETINNREI